MDHRAGASKVSRILTAIEKGDAQAAEDLLPAVYEELRRLAARHLSHESAGQTLQPTALVHEAYVRLCGIGQRRWAGRAHFFAAAAEAMRRILIDRARRKGRIKHGGSRQRFDLDDADMAVEAASDDLLALNEALVRLAEEDPVKAELVKLRYFAGIPLVQAAKMLGISRATASRYWTYARAWLYDEMTKGH